MTHSAVDIAIEIADDHLFPTALQTDARRRAPTEHLNRLRDAGLYGLHSPTELGGSAADRATVNLVLEALAGGCLTTAFVWNQHAGPAKATAATTGPMHDMWARRLATGEATGGVAFAHLLRPGDPALRAEPAADGWTFHGTAPFVTGWGHIDVALVAARHEDDVVWAIVDAVETPTTTPRRLDLSAVDASATVELTFAQHHIPAGTVTHIEPYDQWHSNYHLGLRPNGSLALGVTARCLSLLGPTALDDELVAARDALDTASPEQMVRARADAALLCVRASSALLASQGGRAVAMSNHAQRLAREAMFLLVQGQTAAIRSIMVDDLVGSRPSDRRG